MFQSCNSLGQVRLLYKNVLVRRSIAAITIKKNQVVARSSKRRLNCKRPAILRQTSAARAANNGLSARRPTPRQYLRFVGGAVLRDSWVWETPSVRPLPPAKPPAHPNPFVTAENCETPAIYTVESRCVFSLPQLGQEY